MAVKQTRWFIEGWSFSGKAVPKEMLQEEEQGDMALLEFTDIQSEGGDKYTFPIKLDSVEGFITELKKLQGNKIHVASADQMPKPPEGA